MAKVKITGHASGTGVVTVTAPNTSTDRTITLPDATATIATTADVAARLPSITDGGNATAMTITSAEKIGIGTATPICLVELEHSNTTALSGDGDDSAINIHNTGGVNAISTISFSGGDHNGDGNLAGIYAKHTNVTENSETTDIGFKTSLNEVQVDNLILRGDRGLSQFTAKAWANCKQTGTQSIRDSHNCSSITDMEVGGSKLNFTSNMASATFVTLVSNQWGDVRAGVYNAYRGVDHTRWYCVTAGGQTQVDADTTDVMVFGD